MQIAADGDLIDFLLEDDALLPPSLSDHDFLGFRFSVSERSCCEGIFPPANDAGIGSISGTKGSEKTLPGRSHEYEKDRKSLCWHSAFLTNEGILNTEELMLYNQGLKKAELLATQTRNTSQSAQKPPKVLSRSYSMPRVPAKRTAPGNKDLLSRSDSMPKVPPKTTATGDGMTVHKKPRSCLSSSVVSSYVSSSSGGSVQNLLKSVKSFLKKKVDSGNAASFVSPSSFKIPSRSSSTKSKVNKKGRGHPSRRLMPKIMPSWSSSENSKTDELSALTPSTPPHKQTSSSSADTKLPNQSIACTPPTKETMFHTPGSRHSGLRLPSARFGFFDLEERSSSRWEKIFHSAPTSTPEACSEIAEVSTCFQSPTTTSTAIRITKMLTGSVPSAATAPLTNANEKENKFNGEARVDGLSKQLYEIDLGSDPVTDLQGKKGATQLCLTDQSATRPSKARRSALASVRQRIPLGAYNRSHYTCTSSR